MIPTNLIYDYETRDNSTAAGYYRVMHPYYQVVNPAEDDEYDLEKEGDDDLMDEET